MVTVGKHCGQVTLEQSQCQWEKQAQWDNVQQGWLLKDLKHNYRGLPINKENYFYVVQKYFFYGAEMLPNWHYSYSLKAYITKCLFNFTLYLKITIFLFF